jgi:hypothetical protein
MTRVAGFVVAVALFASGCAALPRETLAPTERGDIKTGTNITREREAMRRDPNAPSTHPIAPAAPPVGMGGARGG